MACPYFRQFLVKLSSGRVSAKPQAGLAVLGGGSDLAWQALHQSMAWPCQDRARQAPRVGAWPPLGCTGCRAASDFSCMISCGAGTAPRAHDSASGAGLIMVEGFFLAAVLGKRGVGLRISAADALPSPCRAAAEARPGLALPAHPCRLQPSGPGPGCV